VTLIPESGGGAFSSGELAGLPPGVAAASPACLDSTAAFFFVCAIFGLERLELLLQQLGLSLQALDLLGIGQGLCCRRAESQGTDAADEGATHQALSGMQVHLRRNERTLQVGA
jgi:hypothetical protein